MSEDNVLIYLLNLVTVTTSVLTVNIGTTHRLKNGHNSKPKLLRNHHFTSELGSEVDKEIFHWLDFIRKQNAYVLEPGQYPLLGVNGVNLLKQLLTTERCFWANPDRPLQLGPGRKASIEWMAEGSGLQRLHCRIPGETNIALPLTPPWYIDLAQHLCGPLDTGFEPETIAALLAAPPLKPEQVKQMMQALQKITKAQPEAQISYAKTRFLDATVTPCLTLRSLNLALKPSFTTTWQTYQAKLPLAELRFHYQQAEVALNDPTPYVSYIHNHEMFQIRRDLQGEKNAIDLLISLGLNRLKDSQQTPVDNHYADYFLISDNSDTKGHLYFLLQDIPILRDKGWKIIIDETYPYRLIQDIDSWYTKLDSNPHPNWFNLELGITLHGENINLLPLLVELIQKDQPLKSPWLMVPLSDGHYLPVPRERIANILKILTELYDAEGLNGANQLPLSKLRAAQVVELPDVLGTSKLRWIGNEKLLQFAADLKKTTDNISLSPPENLKLQLRPYQLEGLCWLQFLRNHALAGILADDMGLGKTIQTLTHLLLEKNLGRQDLPNLLIIPTSLVMNWRLEAERYTPDLKLLVLHGNRRQDYFADLAQYDLIITTYPLLLRDKAILLAQAYYYLILDEAHLIKNPQAKMTQIVSQIDSRYRICLTGTPLENHLGELWSLFNFLLPGLLGKHEQFRRIFQIPIEKNADNERHAILKQRIAPFLLRRTKESVAKELPSKTEIIRQVELEDAQRDLYEGIRLAMHQRVIQAIQEKGLNNSRITILDALLRLRQVCCDPRLIKLSSVHTANIPSAKLLLLMEMLPNLIAEGRRILLFSQFTQMLHLIEIELRSQQIPYVILTGRTKDRITPIETFQNGAVPLFLISLKAGGVGLNLTAADTVIHYDPWWNPAVENQANDRAHRIGQDKPIFIYKMIAHGTVEDKILEMQQRKQTLSQQLLNQDAPFTAALDNIALERLFGPIEQLGK